MAKGTIRTQCKPFFEIKWTECLRWQGAPYLLLVRVTVEEGTHRVKEITETKVKRSSLFRSIQTGDTRLSKTCAGKEERSTFVHWWCVCITVLHLGTLNQGFSYTTVKPCGQNNTRVMDRGVPDMIRILKHQTPQDLTWVRDTLVSSGLGSPQTTVRVHRRESLDETPVSDPCPVVSPCVQNKGL